MTVRQIGHEARGGWPAGYPARMAARGGRYFLLFGETNFRFSNPFHDVFSVAAGVANSGAVSGGSGRPVARARRSTDQ